MTIQNKAKWLRFLILILGGGTIYKLANLKDAFYVPMQEFMGLSHTEIGVLLSANAIIATALFVVGGLLADRFDTRKLIPSACSAPVAWGSIWRPSRRSATC